MLPTLFELEVGDRSLALDAHGLCIMLGAIAGLLLTLRLGRARGLDQPRLRELALELMLIGAVGARMFFVAFHASAYLADCRDVRGWMDALTTCARPLWLWEDGFSFPGGLFTALLWLTVRAPTFFTDATPGTPPMPTRGPNAVLALADLFSPGLALSHVFAKIGCLLAGCCYGAATARAWGLRFPIESVAYQRMLAAGLLPLGADRTPSLEPVQLWEAAADALLCGVLISLWRRARGRTGVCLVVYLATQACVKLAFTWLRLSPG